MKCDEMKELLSAWSDGETTEDETQLVKRHLAECGACRNTLQRYSEIDKGICGIPGFEEPDDFGERLRAKLDAGLRRRRLFMITKYAAAAVLLVSIAATALLTVRPESGDMEPEYFAELPNFYLLDDPDFLGIGHFDEGIGSAMELEIAVNNIF